MNHWALSRKHGRYPMLARQYRGPNVLVSARHKLLLLTCGSGPPPEGGRLESTEAECEARGAHVLTHAMEGLSLVWPPPLIRLLRQSQLSVSSKRLCRVPMLIKRPFDMFLPPEGP